MFSIDNFVTLWHAMIGLAEAAPPLELFVAMTLLPLVGVPVSPFWIAAGIRLGPIVAMAASIASLALNAAIGYWLAHRALRAPLAAWLARRGYTIPRLNRSTETQFILMVRIAPPMPLFVQNCVLGVAGVRFLPYLLLSVLVQAGYAFGFVWFGSSLTDRQLWRVVVGICVLVGISLAMSIVRSLLRARLPGTGVLPR